jgi:uncharacterized membrane protein
MEDAMKIFASMIGSTFVGVAAMAFGDAVYGSGIVVGAVGVATGVWLGQEYERWRRRG